MTSLLLRKPGTLALGLVLALVALGILGIQGTPTALAQGTPPGCNQNNLSLSLGESRTVAKNGDVINYSVTLSNNLTPAIACQTTNITLNFVLPAADGTDTGVAFQLDSGLTLNPGEAQTYTIAGSTGSAGVRPCPNCPLLAYTVAVNPGVQFIIAQANDTFILQTVTPVQNTDLKRIAATNFELRTTASNTGTVNAGTPITDLFQVICPLAAFAGPPAAPAEPNHVCGAPPANPNNLNPIGPFAGGVATFFLCGPGQANPVVVGVGCPTGGTLVGPDFVVNSQATSSPVNTAGSPLGAGFYCFRVDYASDNPLVFSNGSHTNATTECFTVAVPPDVDIVTQATASGGTLPVSVFDTATITGNSGPAAGTVSFFLCNPTEITVLGCPTGGTADPNNPLPINAGGVSVSSTTNLGVGAIPGKYCYRVVYNPAVGSPYAGIPLADRTHTNATTECFTVTPPGPGGETDLEVDKFCNDPQEPLSGQPFTCTIYVVNNGPNTATGVVMIDTIPAGLIYVSDDRAECVFEGTLGQPGGRVVCTVGTLPVGTTFRANIIFRPVVVFTPTAVINIVDITATSPLTDNPGNHHFEYRTWVFPYEADMTIKGQVEGAPPSVNQSALYSVSIKNNGPHSAKNVKATIELSPKVLLGAITTQAGTTCTPTSNGTTKIECLVNNPGRFNHGAQSLVTFRFTPTTEADVTIKLKVESDMTSTDINSPGAVDRNLANNEYTQVVQVQVKRADLAVQVSDSVDPVTAGGNVVYTIRVKNNGPDAAANVSLANVLSAGATFVSGTGACAANQAACNLGTIANGQEVSVTVTVMSPNVAGSMSLKATATTPSANDNNSGNNSATETTQVNAASVAPSRGGTTGGGTTGGSTGGRR